MVHSLREEQIEQLAATVVQGMREKKARDIVTLDLRHIPNTVCDFFVICSGDSSTHVEGISGSVQEMTRKQLNDRPWHVEGLGNSEWVLLDYVNVVVHVFQREPRDYYSIERLWADAIITEHDEDGTDVVFKAAGKKPAKAAVKVAKAPAKKATAKKPAAKAPARAKNAAAKPAVRTVKSALAKTAKAPAEAAKTAVKSATVPAKKVAAKPAAKAKSAAAKPAKAASKTVKAAAAKTAKAPIKTAKAPAKSAKTPAKKASRA
jgi:ribosome-associated protein